MPPQVTSFLGLVVLIFVAWMMSNQRRSFPWRAVIWGVVLQFAFGLFILKTWWGEWLFRGAQTVVSQLASYANQGAAFVFGPLADTAQMEHAFGPAGAFVFAISVSATIILISALSSLLYHWGLLQKIVAVAAGVMQKAMGTSGSESLAAAANIFLGQTEAALLVKPYISKMTLSEVMALMTTGMATIATGVMVVYAGLPGMEAGHILTASVMSAPAGLLMAKVMFPEREASETGKLHHFKVERTTVNSIDALCRGAGEGVALSLNVMGMLIAFVAVVALANAMFGWGQELCRIKQPVTLQQMLGWINAPFAWVIGVPWKDCSFAGRLLGERIVLNEFISYLNLSNYVKANPAALDHRSVILISYALCGFANFSSIAIQIGGIGSLAPERRGDLARLGLRAMIAGLLASYLTATVVGVMI